MSQPLVVGKVWDSEYPWDVRVEKVCRVLADAGHRVELVCRNRSNLPAVEEHPALRIHRMPFRASWPGSIERLSSFPAFFSPRWYRLLTRTFAATGVDVIVSRDLPLAPLALAVGRRLRRPVIVDVAEHYPGLVADLFNWHDFRLANLVIRNPLLTTMVERLTLPRADGIWVVVDEMAQRLAGLGVDRGRITLVSNTPLPNRLALAAEGAAAQPDRSPNDPLRLVYLGNVERSRGLAVVVEAISRLERQPSDGLALTLDVFGDGTGYQSLVEQVQRLELGHRITIHGRQPYERVLQQLGRYDVGVIPHHATDHWNYTVQNKLFDYMSASLAVVVSEMPPAVRIVREDEAGTWFADRDPDDLIRALARVREPGERVRMGMAGRRAVETQYNWSFDGTRLVESVERLGRRDPALRQSLAPATARQ